MASDLNMVALVGRLVREAELRYSNNGMAILRFSIAVNRTRRVQNDFEDEVNYFDCVYFGRGAESVNQFLEKGRQVAISGELRQSRWEQDGQTRSRVEIAVNTLSLLSSPRREGDGYPSEIKRGGVSPSHQNTRKQAVEDVNIPDDDLHGPEDFSDDTIPF